MTHSGEHAELSQALAMLERIARAFTDKPEAAQALAAGALRLSIDAFAAVRVRPGLLSLGRRYWLGLYLERLARDDVPEVAAIGRALRTAATRQRAAHWIKALQRVAWMPEADRDRFAWEQLGMIDDTSPPPPVPSVDPDELELRALWLETFDDAARARLAELSPAHRPGLS